MFPVPGLDQIRVAWILIEREGFLLYGFLLYTSSDRAVVDYIKEGIFDLDILSGNECAIFIIESPSKEWIEYTQRSNNSWWLLFGKELTEKFSREKAEPSQQRLSLLERNIIENNHNCSIVIGDGNIVSLWQIIEPQINLLYNRAEALRVAKYFGLDSKDIPCLIFFKNLKSQIIWKSSIEDLDTQNDLKKFFREFFDSNDFKALLSGTEIIK